MPFAVWITGLPGSGKSTIAKELIKIMDKEKIKLEYLELDKIRKKIIIKPQYTGQERDFVYKKFVNLGLIHFKQNKNVVFDATAHKIKYRKYARKKINNFIEVYIKCPINICITRESRRKQGVVIANMYNKALQRKKTGKKFSKLGKVIGIDVPFEESKAEITINSAKTKPKKAANIVFGYLKKNNLI